jgi:hypothetical protein
LKRTIRFTGRIEEIVHDSLKGTLGTSVSPDELASWKNSLRHMDTVLEDAGIFGDGARRPGAGT